ncbi:MAG: DeoR/GlpR transcriptional regulator [Erysipelotrichia bacterium]|nr:DeoR/GlpR transcriptional regulator [Erysipelotrichia bacterium]NCC55294.1 DeoR/GlpR transcriptional regulator [Erysipelotrichia bacterium]
MLSTERKIFLLNRLERDGTIHVKEIANELNISETTIRRDLIELEEEKRVTRVYGGAVKVGLDSILTEMGEVPMSDRMNIHYDIKAKLCKKASELVQDGECVFLDGGTSIVAMIDYLAKRPVKIVTHNHLIVQKLNNPIAEIIVIGGKYNAKYKMSEGPSAENALMIYNFDRCFIGCAGVDLASKQTYTAEMGTREIKNIAMANANHSYLLVDDSKIGVKGFCKFKETKAFDYIFCNRFETEDELLENFMLVD